MNENNGPFSMQVGFSVIHRHGRLMNDKAVRQFRLTGQQMGYLKYINDNPGASQEDVARAMRIDKGAVAKAVKDMADKGFVRREQNNLDRRAYCLFPTEKAQKVAECGEAYTVQFEKQLTEGMTAEEVKQFKILFGKITANMVTILERGSDI